MGALDLARWQFGITTVYHFIFVPLTIGLSPLVALLQTFWVKTGKDEWYRLTRFFGKLLLINFALGIVTGIVQEFQFGMNWSEYSRYVGDIFGAPLAMEALAAFFIESTFLGIWIFGWGRLSKGVHLATIWLVAFAVNLSAFFILAANSFMQYPVGAKLSDSAGNLLTPRADMASLGDMLFSKLSLSTFWHTISTSFLVAGTFMAGICVWWIVKSVRKGNEDLARNVYRRGAVVGTVTIIVAGISLILSGHNQAVITTEIQPTKMAAAEALCATPEPGQGAAFTVAPMGKCVDGEFEGAQIIPIKGLLSFLATGDSAGEVKGMADLQAEFDEVFAPIYGEGLDYNPPVMVTAWSFRLMIGLGIFSAVLAIWALIALRGGRVSGSGGLKTWALVTLPMPFLASAFGWIFTEIGRQPWIVYPIYQAGAPSPDIALRTAAGVSPDSVVNAGSVAITLVVFTLIYLILAVFWFKLMVRYTGRGVDESESIPTKDDDNDDSKPLSFAY
ncbi:MAG: cytochrome ubiquinol oxidase subunit I [Bifidobacteriaceae bacterium]|nr:cytochrome ubiquinol oxidase subunit I [Bifidobacteriaceae bacterium]